MRAAARPAPVRARTRGPVSMIFEAAFALLFVALVAWFIGFAIELAGNVTLWRAEGAVAHSERMGQQDLGYIAAAPRSVFVDDTEAFAERLISWVALPFAAAGVLALYERHHGAGATTPARADTAADAPSAARRRRRTPGFALKGGMQRATQSALAAFSKWAVVAMHVAQDVALRLSVALFALPAFLLACLVGLVDGLVRRDLRRWRGGRESSFVYHHAKRYTGWALTGGFGIYLTWPVGGFNPAYMVLVFAVLVAATLSTTVAAFKKYV